MDTRTSTILEEEAPLPGATGGSPASASPVSSSPSPGSPLSPLDHRLLDALLAADAPLSELATAHTLSAAQLLAWSERPEIQARLASLQTLSDLHSSLQATKARAVALATLTDLARTAPEPVERRRAAVALVRICSAPPPGGRGRGQVGGLPERSTTPHAPADPDRPSAPTPQPSPAQPHLTPPQLTRLLLPLLQNPDYPTQDAGLRAAAAYSSLDPAGLAEQLAKPHLRPLRGHRAATVGRSRPSCDVIHEVPVRVRYLPEPPSGTAPDPTGDPPAPEERTADFTLRFYRAPADPDAPWQLVWFFSNTAQPFVPDDEPDTG